MNVHPEYRKAQRRLLWVGWGAIIVGCIGLALPFVPGVVPILFGFSLVSFESRRVHRLSARLQSSHPDIAHSLRTFETWCADVFHLSTHTHEYVPIASQHGTDMQGLVEISHHKTGVAVILHSASGAMETSVQNVLAEVCRAQGLTVVRFNARHGLGESGSTFTDFTVSTYREDLRDVLAWAQTQSWWGGPLTLVGHSAGALVATLYAEEHPDQVGSLVLLAPTVSGTSYYEAFEHMDPNGLTEWREGRLRMVRHPLSGECFSLSYGFVEDILQYDALPNAKKLTMPVTVIAGGNDVTSPPELCFAFAEAVGPHARSILIPKMHHTPEEPREIRALAKGLRVLTRE